VMCYSAQIQDAYDKYVRHWGADKNPSKGTSREITKSLRGN